MITDASKAVVLAGDQDEAKAAWSGQAGVDATLQGTRLSKGPGGEERWIEAAPPARSLSMVLVAEVRGRRRNAPRQAGPAGPPTTGISIGADHRHPGLGHPPAPHRECLGWGWAVNDGALSQALPLAGVALTVRFLEPARVVGELGGGLE